MKIKKIISVFVTAGMLFSLGTSLSFAQVEPISIDNAHPITFELGNSSCTKGETTNIKLSVENIPSNGLQSFVLNISYDKTKLEYLGMEPGEIIYDKTNDLFENITSQGLKVMYSDYSDTGNSLISSDGLICDLKFKALCENGITPLTFSKEWKYEHNNPLKDAVFVNGTINVTSNLELYGDLNNDKFIDSLDYFIFTGYLLGKYTPDKNDTNFTKRTDVNGDGLIDTADCTFLKQFVMGMIDEFPVGASF